MGEHNRDYLFFGGEFLYSVILPDTRRRALLSAAALPDMPQGAAGDLALYKNLMYGMLAMVAVFALTLSLAVLILGAIGVFFARRVAERLYASLSPYLPADGRKSVHDYLHGKK